ncbi:MAG: hypothetical protein ACTTJC_02310 [Campylobacter sp.]
MQCWDLMYNQSINSSDTNKSRSRYRLANLGDICEINPNVDLKNLYKKMKKLAFCICNAK